MMATGLRATAKAVDHPPEPKIGAPVLDPTASRRKGSGGGLWRGLPREDLSAVNCDHTGCRNACPDADARAFR